MNRKAHLFAAMLFREFLLETQLLSEWNMSDVVDWLGEIVQIRPNRAQERFVDGDFLPFIDAGFTTDGVLQKIQIVPTSYYIRTGVEFMNWVNDTNDCYNDCCRSALCHALRGSYDWAFGSLRLASAKNEDWARHHHLYGLIHGVRGDYGRAIFELEKALSHEPYEPARLRIRAALELAYTSI